MCANELDALEAQHIAAWAAYDNAKVLRKTKLNDLANSKSPKKREADARDLEERADQLLWLAKKNQRKNFWVKARQKRSRAWDLRSRAALERLGLTDVPKESVEEFYDYEKEIDWEGVRRRYFDARYNHLAALAELTAGDDDYRLLKSKYMSMAKVPREYTQDEVWVHGEPPYEDSDHHRVHLYYGGKGSPLGKGHGHRVLRIAADGTYRLVYVREANKGFGGF